MNINTSENYINLGKIAMANPRPSDFGLNVKEIKGEPPLNKVNTKDIAEFEVGEENGLIQDGELFNLTNKNQKWSIDGQSVKFDELDNETKTYLYEFTNVSNDYKAKVINVDFGDLIVNLGKKYATKRDELKEQYSGNELSEKLEKLEKAFNMYTETKVVGNPREVGSMANAAYFSLVEAKMNKSMQAKRSAFLNGQDISKAQVSDITNNDKKAVEALMEIAKKTMKNVTKFYNENGVIKNSEVLKNLYNYTGEGGWSLDKLSTTFELLDKTRDSNPEKYSKDEFKEVVNSGNFNSMFSEDEQKIFKDIFEINKKKL